MWDRNCYDQQVIILFTSANDVKVTWSLCLIFCNAEMDVDHTWQARARNDDTWKARARDDDTWKARARDDDTWQARARNDDTWKARARNDPLEVINFSWWSGYACGFRSLFHCLHDYRMGDFWTFVRISHTINGRFVPTDADKIMHPQHFGTYPTNTGSGSIWNSRFESQITFNWNFAIGRGLHTLSAHV